MLKLISKKLMEIGYWYSLKVFFYKMLINYERKYRDFIVEKFVRFILIRWLKVFILVEE